MEPLIIVGLVIIFAIWLVIALVTAIFVSRAIVLRDRHRNIKE